jgi:hypothetical protein
VSTGVVMRDDQRRCLGECHKIRVVKFFVGDSKICFTCQQLTLCSKRKIELVAASGSVSASPIEPDDIEANASTSPCMDLNTSVLHCSKCNRDYESYEGNWICHGCSTRSPEYRINLKKRKQMKITNLKIPEELLSNAERFYNKLLNFSDQLHVKDGVESILIPDLFTLSQCKKMLKEAKSKLGRAEVINFTHNDNR